MVICSLHFDHVSYNFYELLFSFISCYFGHILSPPLSLRSTPHLSSSKFMHAIPLSKTNKKNNKNENKVKKRQKISKTKYNKTKQIASVHTCTHISSLPTLPGHGTCPGVWLIYPLRPHWSKLIVLSLACITCK